MIVRTDRTNCFPARSFLLRESAEGFAACNRRTVRRMVLATLPRVSSCRPKKAGPFGLIWGLGPAFLYPTGTHPLLGTGTFSMGPTFVGLKQEGPWTVGVLMNQLWSVVIEEHRSSYSAMFVQPFITYTTKHPYDFHSLTRNPRRTGMQARDGKWTVPVIFQISQILKIGKQPNQHPDRRQILCRRSKLRTQLGCALQIHHSFCQQGSTLSLLSEPAW